MASRALDIDSTVAAFVFVLSTYRYPYCPLYNSNRFYLSPGFRKCGVAVFLVKESLVTVRFISA